MFIQMYFIFDTHKIPDVPMKMASIIATGGVYMNEQVRSVATENILPNMMCYVK